MLINTSRDYADEFDYPVISFFNSALKNYLILKGLDYLKESDVTEMYFGSNEAISMSIREVKLLITEATILNDEEHTCAKRYLNEVPALDIMDRILDTIYERMGDEDPDEIPNFQAVLDTMD